MRVARSRRGPAVAAALLADVLLGDSWLRPHPVAVLGTAMTTLEGRIWRDSRAAGVGYALAGAGGAALLGAAVGRLGDAGTAAATFVAVAPRELWSAARAVEEALAAGDLAAARRLLPALAGRDPCDLDEKELARAVVESVAENTVDAVVAPACWALAGGAAGVVAHRAVNTMDAMVGHRDERYGRFGWASARLDDVAAWLPARGTALLVACARPARAADVLRVVRRDAPAHPSPNAGVAEAAFAAALGLVLGGENRYRGVAEVRPPLGEGRLPEPADIGRTVRLSADVTLLLAGVCALVTGRRRTAG